MWESSSSVWKLGKYFLFGYTFVSLLFTLNHFYTTSHHSVRQDDAMDLTGLHPRAGQEILDRQAFAPHVRAWSNSQGT